MVNLDGKEAKNFKDVDIDDIIDWCTEHGETEWLKAKAAEKIEVKQYPRKKIWSEEKQKDVYVADKDKEPKIKKRRITFVQIKFDFYNKFLPHMMPKKEKKKSMFDKIAEL